MSTTTIIIQLSLPPSTVNLENLKSPATIAWTDTLKLIAQSDIESKPDNLSVCAHDTNGDVLLVIQRGNTSFLASVLPTLFRPLLPYFTAPARVFTAESKSVYAPPQRKITAATIFLPWGFETDRLDHLWTVVSMYAEKAGKIVGIRFGGSKVVSGEDALGIRVGKGEKQEKGEDGDDGDDEKEKQGVDGDVGLMYNGEKCKVWMIWFDWTGDEGNTHLGELVNCKRMGAVGWEEREWRFEKVEDMVKELRGGSCCIM